MGSGWELAHRRWVGWLVGCRLRVNRFLWHLHRWWRHSAYAVPVIRQNGLLAVAHHGLLRPILDFGRRDFRVIRVTLPAGACASGLISGLRATCTIRCHCYQLALVE